jgi:hypothetical protein
MYNPNLKLTELFKDNSLRNLRTNNHCPMAHSVLGNTYYITISSHGVEYSKIKEILEKGNHWVYAKYSISSYIDLSDKASELISTRLIKYGPQSNSSSFHISCYEELENIKVIATGWGSSSIELYDGNKEEFLQYLQNHQKREA